MRKLISVIFGWFSWWKPMTKPGELPPSGGH